MRTFSSWWLIAFLAISCTSAPPKLAASPPARPSPLAAASPSPSPGQQMELALPEARQEVGMAANTKLLWVMGGFDPQRQSASATFYYDGSIWRRGPELPLAVDHPAAASPGVTYLAGGFSNGPAVRRVFRLDLDAWHDVAPLHHARGAAALVPVADKLYAVGGRGPNGEVAEVEAYDNSNTWTDITSLPLPRDHVAGFAYQGKVCVAGGRSPNTARVDCYDPAAKAWSRLPDLPKPTSGAGAIALGDEVVVAGGEDAQEGQLVPFVQRFKDGAWTVEPMLMPRHGIQLAFFNGRAWACGGADQPAYHAVATCTSIGP